MVQPDRRGQTRMSTVRPCKLFVPQTGKYVPATTCDLSAGGALVTVDRPLPLLPGERLFLGVAVRRRQGLLLSRDMNEAVVTRSLRAAGGPTTLAVRFVRSDAIRCLVERRAA